MQHVSHPSSSKVQGEVGTGVDNRQNSMHCTTHQITRSTSSEKVVAPILGAILGGGQGLMKPNLGGQVPAGQRGTWYGVLGRQPCQPPVCSRSNKLVRQWRHGMLTGPIAQTGLADTRCEKRGRVATVKCQVGRKLVTDWGLCNVLEMCSRSEERKRSRPNLAEPGKLWPGSVSSADQ